MSGTATEWDVEITVEAGPTYHDVADVTFSVWFPTLPTIGMQLYLHHPTQGRRHLATIEQVDIVIDSINDDEPMRPTVECKARWWY